MMERIAMEPKLAREIEVGDILYRNVSATRRRRLGRVTACTEYSRTMEVTFDTGETLILGKRAHVTSAREAR